MSGTLFKRSKFANAEVFAMRKFCIAIAFLLAVAFCGNAFAQGAALGCGTDFYQTRSGSGGAAQGTSLLRFTAANLSGGGTATNVWGVVDADQVNGVGLNPNDGFIYGLIASGNRARLAQLGTTGAVDVSSIVAGQASIITNGSTLGVTAATTLASNTAFTPTAGVFDSTGRFYFAGQGGTPGVFTPPAIYRIDNLVPNASGNIIVAQVYSLSTAVVNIGDFAFGPDGNLYGATGTTLVQLALTGNTANVTTKTIATVGGIGSAFFNNAGEFFVYENSTGNLTQILFSFGSGFAAGAATTFAPVVIAGAAPLPTNTNSTDGASCITFNADLTVTKTNGSSTPLVSGSTTTYTIRVTNNGPSLAAGAIFSDPAVTGLNKTVIACSAAASNQCATPPTITELQSGTFTLPTLTVGQFYEITVTATVTATGI
jgi:uncharacterized repeat protein (TIGR01451 family)